MKKTFENLNFSHSEKLIFLHNLLLALCLSTIAGCVNAIGFISTGHFTTSVTTRVTTLGVGIAENSVKFLEMGGFWWILFLGGAIFSNATFHYFTAKKKDPHHIYMFQLFLEGVFFIILIITGFNNKSSIPEFYYVAAQFFVMGSQNALVTKLSGAIVRTTHVTSMTTDFGMSIAWRFFLSKDIDDRKKWFKQISIQGTVIFSFLLGSFLGAISYLHYSFNSYFLPLSIIVILIIVENYYIRAIINIHEEI